MSKVTIFLAGILLINFLAGEAFEYDDSSEYFEGISEAAETLDNSVRDMYGEARQILLNPQRRRERRKKRIGMYQNKFATMKSK